MIRKLALAALLSPIIALPALADHAPRHMHVVKNAGCGCCSAWADIAREHGFDVTVDESEDYAGYKKAMGVPLEIAGCHSARIGGYVVEGHVPMNAIERLLAEKPDVHGIAVPGMPMGSPGMGDDPKARYDVISFKKPDQSTVKIFEKVGQ